MQRLIDLYEENAKTMKLKAAVYEAIHTAIITNILPAGYRVKDAEIAELLKISRSPVREALHILLKQDLVTAAGTGYIVKQFTVTEGCNIMSYTMLLREEAVRRLLQTATPEQIASLEEKTLTWQGVQKKREEGDITWCYMEYQNFYYEAAVLSGNPYLYQELKLMQEKLLMLHHMYTVDMKNEFSAETYAVEHGRILQLLKEKNEDPSADSLGATFHKKKNVAKHVYYLRKDWK